MPELAGGSAWPYEAVGVAFAVVGVALIVFGYARQKRVTTALERGEFAPLGDGPALAFALLGVVLAVATIALVVAHPG